MYHMLLGAISMASFVAGLFFLRFWKTSKDRFFLFFALAFWIEAVNRVALALVDPTSEKLPLFYFIRFIAFALILFAIADKNIPRKTPRV